jgi:CRP-like cAMP-binding protein
MIRADLIRFKANSKLFSLMDDAGIDRMANVATEANFKAGDAIIQEGERGNLFYLIVAGNVRVVADGLEGPKEVARLAAGQFFGEMAVLNDEPRTASVIAIADVRCLAFAKNDVVAILNDYPKIRQVLGLVGLKRAEQLIDAQMK